MNFAKEAQGTFIEQVKNVKVLTLFPIFLRTYTRSQQKVFTVKPRIQSFWFLVPAKTLEDLDRQT